MTLPDIQRALNPHDSYTALSKYTTSTDGSVGESLPDEEAEGRGFTPDSNESLDEQAEGRGFTPDSDDAGAPQETTSDEESD